MTARVRVLSIIDELGFGGDENRLLSLATTIDRDRFDHAVVTIRKPEPARAESWAMHGHYAAAGVAVSSLGEVPHATPASKGLRHCADSMVRLGRKVQAVRRLVTTWRPDVIDAHLQAAGLVGVLAGAAPRTPTVVTLYSPVPPAPPPLWSVMGRAVMGLARVVVTDSEARQNDIRRWMRPFDPRVLVIPNGIEPPATSRTTAEMRAALGLPSDPRVRVIGQVASLVRHKGHRHLLDAARVVLARHPSTMFLLVGFSKGEAACGDEIAGWIRELGLGDRVRVVSYPGPIGDVWTAIDIQVHASTYDSLPNALIEGMSLAKPIVATTVGGVSGMLEDGHSALLVPPGDAAALARALVRLLEDPALAARLGRAACDRHRARFQASVMTRALEACFSAQRSPR
jgi:glycosyltransferase involved in cell wall biosynthesis